MIRSTHQSVRLRSVYRTVAPYRHPFHWWEAGSADAPTIILLHGFMAHAMAYRRILDALAERYHLVIPDLPGHGRDQTFCDDRVHGAVEALGEWLHHLITAFPGPIHLVGHSLGATAAYVVAKERDEQVRTITLVSPGFKLPPSELGRRALGLLPARVARLASTRAALKVYEPIQWRGTPMGDGEVESYLGPMKEVDRVRFIMSLAADLLEQPDRTSMVQGIEIPTLLIWGAHDRLLGLENSLVIRDRLPGAELVILEDAGHSPMEDTPREFVEALEDFLESRSLSAE